MQNCEDKQVTTGYDQPDVRIKEIGEIKHGGVLRSLDGGDQFRILCEVSSRVQCTEAAKPT